MSQLALHTRDTAHWRALVTAAEASTKSCLDDELESYLVMLLLRFAARERPAATQSPVHQPYACESAGAEPMREVGDRCLVITGLMADQALDMGMSIGHFVDTGRHAYYQLAARTGNPLYSRLAEQFVVLMDVLQVMRTLDEDELLVDLFRIYDQWQETGSQHAFRLLKSATGALPVMQFSRSRH